MARAPVVGNPVSGERRLTGEDALALLSSAGMLDLGVAATRMREQLHPGSDVTFIVDPRGRARRHRPGHLRGIGRGTRIVQATSLRGILAPSSGRVAVVADIEEKRRELAAFCRLNHIRRLSLFGSAAKGTAGPDSDLDLLAEFEPGRTPGLRFFEMQDELSRLLGRKVDLHTPGSLSRYFREDVRRTAEVLCARD